MESPGGAEERGPVAFWLPYAFAMILYVTIFSAASFLLQSVTEEVVSRRGGARRRDPA